MSIGQLSGCLVLAACVLSARLLAAAAEGAAGGATNLLAHARFQEVETDGAPVAWGAACDRASINSKLTVELPAGGRREKEIDTGIARPGFHRLHLTTGLGGHTLARKVRAASLQPVPPGDSHFGMNHAYGWPQLLDLCDRIGVRWMRDRSLKWQHVQPKPGPFDFSATDYQIDRVLERKLPLLALLPFSANDWAADVPAGLEKAPRGALEA